MSRNIELKARIDSIEALPPAVRTVAGGEPLLILQDDTFFRVAHGRLKLREYSDGDAELIHCLQESQSDAEDTAVAEALMTRLGLARAVRLAGSYLDLQSTAVGETPAP